MRTNTQYKKIKHDDMQQIVTLNNYIMKKEINRKYESVFEIDEEGKFYLYYKD